MENHNVTTLYDESVLYTFIVKMQSTPNSIDINCDITKGEVSVREIKFRAVDKETSEIYDADRIERDDSIIITLSYGELVGFYVSIGGDYEELTLNQWTGLTDKNGKEIYEGDIVQGRYRAYEMQNVAQKVTYLNGCFMFGNWNAHEYFNRHQEIEVIGNIYDGD